MAPGDRMAIVSLNGDRMELTDDRSRLLRSIDCLLPSGPVAADSDRRLIGEHLLETVAALSRQIAEESARPQDHRRHRRRLAVRRADPAADVGREPARRMDRGDAGDGASPTSRSMPSIPGGIGTSRFGGSDGFARRPAATRS